MELHTWNTPNGTKPLIFLEEAGVDYTLVPVDLSAGGQSTPEYLALNPNGRIPTLKDGSLVVYESQAILFYLAERERLFLPASGAARNRTVQWLMWEASSMGPAVVQLGHFLFRDERLPYAIDRFANSCVRLLRVLNTTLEREEFVAGEYSIADMALFPFVRVLWKPLGGLRPSEVESFGATAAWLQRLERRPAVSKALKLLA